MNCIEEFDPYPKDNKEGRQFKKLDQICDFRRAIVDVLWTLDGGCVYGKQLRGCEECQVQG